MYIADDLNGMLQKIYLSIFLSSGIFAIRA